MPPDVTAGTARLLQKKNSESTKKTPIAAPARIFLWPTGLTFPRTPNLATGPDLPTGNDELAADTPVNQSIPGVQDIAGVCQIVKLFRPCAPH
jgi:hypothetical protein